MTHVLTGREGGENRVTKGEAVSTHPAISWEHLLEAAEVGAMVPSFSQEPQVSCAGEVCNDKSKDILKVTSGVLQINCEVDLCLYVDFTT